MTSVQDSSRLDGRTTLVTGAAGLTGRKLVHALADGGANVVAADLDETGAPRALAVRAGQVAAALAGSGARTDSDKEESRG